jgi:aminoglycoside phosphotransferase (APT) family kinase protein
MRRRGSGCEPVLFDWGRARVGSPLEDVSSWLQVLGRWEPEAKRRHDTLLAHYLAARGLTASLTRSLRDAYWLAGASNALAGALLYHLATSVRPDISDQERWLARVAAADWLRVVRRADACLH